MTSEFFVKENRTACVVAGLCYGTEWPTSSFASAEGHFDTVVDFDEMKSVLCSRTARHPFSLSP